LPCWITAEFTIFAPFMRMDLRRSSRQIRRSQRNPDRKYVRSAIQKEILHIYHLLPILRDERDVCCETSQGLYRIPMRMISRGSPEKLLHTPFIYMSYTYIYIYMYTHNGFTRCGCWIPQNIDYVQSRYRSGSRKIDRSTDKD
jgi:hypothetical protein